jgi:hypothetical protein
VPAETADDLADWFEDQSDSGSLVEYLKTFDLTTAVMQIVCGRSAPSRWSCNDTFGRERIETPSSFASPC